jgi:hypothetical protein
MLINQRSKIVGIAQKEAKTVSVSTSMELQKTMSQLLRNSYINLPDLSMDFTKDIGVLSGNAVFINNYANGFIWGMHVWGIHNISEKTYSKIPNIPINNIKEII